MKLYYLASVQQEVGKTALVTVELFLGINHSTFICGHFNVPVHQTVRAEILFRQHIRHMICKGNSSLAVIPTTQAGYSQ